MDKLRTYFKKSLKKEKWRTARPVRKSTTSISQAGNVFFTLFGAVALVGVLGAGIMSTMRGPLTTMVEINKIEEAKADLRLGMRLILLNSTDADSDGFTEPVTPDTYTGGPSGAGQIPSSIAAKKNDPWGTKIAYCAWDHGIDADEHDGAGLLLAGGTSGQNITITLLSAGPDRTFSNTCQADPDYVPALPSGDDIMVSLTYAEAASSSGGLWEAAKDAKTSTIDVATIDRGIEVAGGAVFTDILDTSTAGLIIPDETALATCNLANSNVLRVDDTADPALLQICTNVSGGWVWQGIGATDIWDLNGTSAYYSGGNVGIGTDTPDDALDVVGDIGLTGNLELVDTASIVWGGSTSNISDNSGTLTITGGDTENIAITTSGTTVTGDTSIVGSVTTDASAALAVTDSAAASLLFVRNDGNVGIGTATPNDPLDVAGDIDTTEDYKIRGQVVLRTLSTDTESTVMLGNNAGNSTVTGDNNTILGADAGTLLTSGINNILIGHNADTPLATTNSHLNIGGTIYGDLSNDYVGIGVVAPNDALDVAGDIEATATINAGTTITAGSGITATTGNITASAGNVVASSQILIGTDIIGPVPDCDADDEKLEYTGSNWDCVAFDNTQGGTGTGGVLTLEDILGNGNDAEGQDADDFNDIGADRFCEVGLGSCISSAALITAGGGGGSALSLLDGDGDTRIQVEESSDEDKIRFDTLGAERMIITETGYVGIGTTSPSSTLEITAGNGNQLVLDNDGSQFTQLDFFNNGNARGFLSLDETNDVFIIGAQGGYSDFNYIAFRPDGNTNALTIGRDNNVGIGTTSPSANLEISAGTDGDAVLRLEADTDNDEENDNPYIEFFQDGGNVNAQIGISGASPSAVFDKTITGALENALIMNAGGAGTTPLQLSTADTARLSITDTGEVGIGDTTPDTGVGGDGQALLLDVEGPIGGTHFCDEDGEDCFTANSVINSQLWQNDGPGGPTEIYYTADNVGIGTNNPSYPLDVYDAPTATSGTTYANVTSAYANPGGATTAAYRSNLNVASNLSGNNTDLAQLMAGYNLAQNVGTGTITSTYGQYGMALNSGTGTVTSGYGSVGVAQNNSTGTLTSGYGGYNYAINANTGTMTNAYGAYNYVLNNSTGTITTARGSYNYVRNNSTATMPTAYGVQSIVENSSTGTITAAYGLSAYLTNPSGTVTNWRGVYVSDEGTDDNYYSIFTDGTTKSYFGGAVGFGDLTPDQGGDQPLVIDAEGAIGATHYCDQAGNNCSTASAIADVASGAIDWDNITDTMTLDATTTIDMDTNTADFNFDSNTLFIDSSTNRVGIGTAAPAFNVDIQNSSGTGLIRAKDSDSTYQGIILMSDTGGGYITNSNAFDSEHIYFQNNTNFMRFSTDGTERIRIDASGNVGIGTVSPARLLDLDVGSADDTGYELSHSAGTTSAKWTVTDPGVNNDVIFGTVSNNGLNLITNDTTRMSILNNGNVGIGTASPTQMLTVGAADGTNGGRILLNPMDGALEGGEIRFEGAGAYASDDFVLDNYAGRMRFIRTNPSGSEVMTILQSGNVGIGTTAPTQLLHVESATAGQGRIRVNETATGGVNVPGYGVYNEGAFKGGIFYDEAGDNVEIWHDTARAINIDTDGNIGIGTVSPGAILDIVGSTRITGSATNELTLNSSASEETTLTFQDNGTSEWQMGANSNSERLFFYSYDLGATVMALTDDGYVGIGTTAPEATLDIYATDAMILPRGTTAQQPAGGDSVNGMMRYDTDVDKFQAYQGGAWQDILTSATGNVVDDSLDWDKFTDGMTLDATTTIDMDTNTADLNFDANTFVIDSSTNRIGIGTATPRAKLTINNGSASIYDLFRVYGDSASVFAFIGQSGTTTLIGSASTSGDNTDIRFQTASSGTEADVMKLTSDGNVGIGTSSPAYRLDVQDTSTATTGTNYGVRNLIAANPGGATTAVYRGQLNQIGNTSGNNTDLTQMMAAYNLAQYTGTGTVGSQYGQYGLSLNTSTGTITSSYGNVGLSQNSGTGTLASSFGNYGYSYNGSTGDITSAYGGYNYVRNFSTGSMGGAYGTLNNIRNDSTGDITSAYGTYTVLANDAGGTVSNWYGLYITGEGTDPNYYSIYTAGDTKSYFGGNVGIGVTAPEANLHIEDSRATSIGNDPMMTIENTAVSSSAYPHLRFINGDGSQASIGMNAAGQTAYGGDESFIMGSFVADRNITFVSNNSPKFFFEGSSGYMGVGTTTPTAVGHFVTTTDNEYALKVEAGANGYGVYIAAGDGSEGALRVADTNSVDRFIVRADGKVGIGTTTPAATLDISATDAMILPRGTTAQQPAGGDSVNGMMRYDTDVDRFQAYQGGAWQDILTSATGNITDDSLDWDKFTDAMTMDADTTIDLSAGDLTLNSGKLNINNTSMGGDALNVFSGSTGNVAAFQSNGMTGSGSIVSIDHGVASTGTVQGLKASLSSSGSASIYLQQNSTGTAIFDALTLSTGDVFSRYAINGGQGWSAGLDNSDSDKFKIASGYGLGTSEDRLTIDTSGNVGIGTTSPSVNLDVSGGTGDVAIRLEADTDNVGEDDNPYIEFSQDGGVIESHIGLAGSGGSAFNKTVTGALSNALIVDTSAGYPVQIGTNDAVRLTVSATGEVGIGTTTPAYKLTVREDTVGTAFQILGTSGNARLSMGSDHSTNSYIVADNGLDLRLGVGTADDITIDSTGNVGIGTTSPTRKLHVSGGDMQLGNFDEASNRLFSLDTVDANSSSIAFRSAGGNVGLISRPASTRDIRIYSQDLAADIVTFETDTGDVGIGDTSPDGTLKLDVEGQIGATEYCDEDGANCVTAATLASGAADDSIDWAQITDTMTLDATTTIDMTAGDLNFDSNTLFIDSSANSVGIGTTAPNTLLEIKGDTNDLLRLDAGTANYPTLQFYGNSGALAGRISGEGGTFSMYYETYSTGDHYFRNAGSDLMTILSTGEVGIGTVSPDTKLDVEGGQLSVALASGSNGEIIQMRRSENAYKWGIGMSSSSKFHLYENGGTERFTVDTDGNVGIGTTSPGAPLHILAPDPVPTFDGTFTTLLLDKPDTSWGGINFAENGTGQYSIRTNTADKLVFSVEGTPDIVYAMTLDTDGNVGINTSTPTYKLDVQDTSTATSGTTYTGYNLMSANPGGATTASYRAQYNLAQNTSGNNTDLSSLRGVLSEARYTGTGTATSIYGAYSLAQNNSTGTAGSAYGAYNSTRNNSTGTISTAYGAQNDITNASSGTINSAYGSNNYILNNFGGTITTAFGSRNVIQNNATSDITTAYGVYATLTGSGTTTSWRGLYITDEGTDANYYSIYTAGDTKSYFGGNVGIGTTSPTAPLTVAKNNSQVRIEDTDGGSAGVIQVNTSTMRLGNWSNGGFVTLDLTNDAMGLGDSTPDQGGEQALKLDVAGAIGGAYYCDENGTNCFTAASVGTATGFEDADGDTKIQVEEGADDDTIRFDIAGTERMVISSSGLVGIGTDSPVNKLHVYGGSMAVQPQIFYGLPATAYDDLDIWGATYSSNQDTGISVHAQNSADYAAWSARFALKSNGSGTSRGAIDLITRDASNVEQTNVEALSFLTSGNVGIGTTAPSHTLHIESDDDADFLLRTSGTDATDDTILRSSIAGTTGSNYIYFGDSADSDAGMLRYNHSTDNLSINTNTAEAMRIDSSGNVGIGTTAPDMQLHILSSTISGDGYRSSMMLENDTYEAMQVLSGTNSGYFNAGHILIANNGSDTRALGTIALDATSNNSWFWGRPYGASDAFAINRRTAAYSSDISDEQDADVTNMFYIESSGDVGIGTRAPGRKLVIRDAGAQMSLRSDDGESSVLNMGDATDDNIGRIEYDNGNNSLIFRTNTADQMTITSSGDVGIGDTSPETELDVEGQVGATEYCDENGANCFTAASVGVASSFEDADNDTKIQVEEGADDDTIRFDTAGAERMVIASSGNVGIGTTAPAYELHIYEGASGATPYSTSDLVIESNLRPTLQFLSPNTQNNAIFFGDPESSIVGQLGYIHSTNTMAFAAGGINTMNIQANKVGIGTTSPDTSLDIEATNSLGSTFTGGTAGEGVRVSQTAYTAGDYVSLIEGKYVTGSATPDVRIAAMYDSGGSNLSFGTSNDYATGITNQALTIDSNGNVGIGTIAPAYPLSVAGTLGIGESGATGNRLRLSSSSGGAIINQHDNSPIIFQTQGVEHVRILDDGNVGIGTDAPTSLLHLSTAGTSFTEIADFKNSRSASSDVGVRLSLGNENSSSGGYGAIYAGRWDTNTRGMRLVGQNQLEEDETYIHLNGVNSSEYISFVTDTAEAMRILNDGSVGIGTSSPATNSHVEIEKSDTLTSGSAYNLYLDYDFTPSGTLTANATGHNIYSIMDGYVDEGSYTGTLTNAYFYARHDSGDVGNDISTVTGTHNLAYHFGSGTATTVRGVYAEGRATSASGTATNLYGVAALARTLGGTATTARGVDAAVTAQGGTITNARGVDSYVAEISGGAITNGYAFYGDCNSATTCYGLYITAGDADVTTDWGVYTTGEDKNYFSGNVGIGTTAPSYELDISGAARIQRTTPTLYMQDSDNLLSADALTGIISFRDSALAEAAWLGYGSTGNDDFYFRNNTAGDMGFATNSAEVMRLSASGNVGIGTTAPDAKLHVMESDASAASFSTSVLDVEKNDHASISIITPNNKVAALYFADPESSTRGAIQYNHGDDSFAVRTAESTHMTIDSSGNVGIGTTAPSARLNIENGTSFVPTTGVSAALTVGGTYGGGILLEDSAMNGGIWGVNSGATLVLDSGGDQSTGFTRGVYGTMALKDGNVGIGTGTPGAMLHIDDDAAAGTGLLVNGGGSGGAMAKFIRDVGSTGTVEISAGGGDPQISFESGANTFALGVDSSSFTISDNTTVGTNDRFTIDSAGNVGIGTTSPDELLDVAGDMTADAYLTNSDRTLKDNIEPLEDSLSKILALDAVGFDWKDAARAEDSGRQIGFIAQEVKEIFPEVVRGEEGKMRVNYAALVAPLVESVKTLKDENDALKAAQDETNATVAELATQVSSLNKLSGNLPPQASSANMVLMALLGLLAMIAGAISTSLIRRRSLGA